VKKLAASLAALVAIGVVAVAVSQATTAKNGRIAFRRYFDNAHTWGAIFTINPDGTGERQVTHPPKGDVDAPPRWAPNASLIAFTRCPKGTCAIYTVRPDGSHLTRLSPPCPGGKCEDDSGASFTPDGRHVVFSRYTGHGLGASIVVTDLRHRHARVVVAGTKHFAYTEPEFSPDGSRVVFVGGLSKTVGVFVATSHGGGVHQVSPTKLDAGDAPTWSPDGRWILFRSHVDGGGQSQIYLVHPNGADLKQLTHFKAGAIVTSSRFSPDGKWIVFGTNGVGGKADVFVMHADGTGMRPVTRTKLWDSAPAWGVAP
jgi:Tol biopolymer transport system component